MPFAVDEHPVGALGPRGAYPSLGVTIRARRQRRDFDRLHALAGEDRVEGATRSSSAPPSGTSATKAGSPHHPSGPRTSCSPAMGAGQGLRRPPLLPALGQPDPRRRLRTTATTPQLTGGGASERARPSALRSTPITMSPPNPRTRPGPPKGPRPRPALCAKISPG